jgi:2-hydroxycyclohexanecarboxyl-CoA dehydrogenase
MGVDMTNDETAPTARTDGTVVVTGAASGIGRATALLLAQRYPAVLAVDLDDAGLERLAAESPGRIAPVGLDVADETTGSRLAARLDGDLPPLWAVVHCAGWDETRPFVDTDPAFWAKVVAINYLGVVRVTHALLPRLLARRAGRVVAVASDAGRVGSSGETVYAGAKGGVIAFMKSLARETARAQVTANTVCPGPTDTPLFRRQPERLQEALARAVPMGRLGRPEDVAAAVAFFCAPEAGYVTGQVLSVSGGLTMAG